MHAILLLLAPNSTSLGFNSSCRGALEPPHPPSALGRLFLGDILHDLLAAMIRLRMAPLGILVRVFVQVAPVILIDQLIVAFAIAEHQEAMALRAKLVKGLCEATQP